VLSSRTDALIRFDDNNPGFIIFVFRHLPLCLLMNEVHNSFIHSSINKHNAVYLFAFDLLRLFLSLLIVFSAL